MYLDYATRQARRQIPMTMDDQASKLDAFFQLNDAEILQNYYEGINRQNKIFFTTYTDYFQCR